MSVVKGRWVEKLAKPVDCMVGDTFHVTLSNAGRQVAIIEAPIMRPMVITEMSVEEGEVDERRTIIICLVETR